MTDYYKILEIPPSSSPEDIKKSFRKLAHKYHPDKKSGNENKFKEISEAYQILSNKEKRAEYDSLRTANRYSTYQTQAQQSNDTNQKVSNKIENWNKSRFIVVLIITMYVLYLFQDQSTNININENSQPIPILPNEQTHSPLTTTNNSKNYISLTNGTILSKNSYFLTGSGELQIKNGTTLDAIAKLVSTDTNKSIFTVYIKAKSTYRIEKINDGNYKLFFNLGNDWDTVVKAFKVNSSYEVFEEQFDFATREYIEGNYINTEYSTFEVTLNPVYGGTAETENIDISEFAKY